MNYAEIQTDIIQLVLETKNPSILKKIAAYIRNLQEHEDWWDDVHENEKSFIQRSARQIDEGKVVPDAVVKAEIKKRLGKT